MRTRNLTTLTVLAACLWLPALAAGCWEKTSSANVECPTGTTNCDGVCSNTDVDPTNCGGCGTSCEGSDLCVNGTCGMVCMGGTTECNDTCVDTDLDPAHCGGCDNACGASEMCVDGSCTNSGCSGTLVPCDGECVNLLTDNRFCSDDGTCGTACAAGEVCDGAGTCALSCQATLDECDGECVNLLTDNRFCSDDGSCGTPCEAGQICNGAGACELDCQVGLTECDQECVNLLTDNRYCSDATDICGTACAPGEICNGAGVCDLDCQTGLTICGAAGSEECVNLLTDNRYCSDATDICGTACAPGEICNGAGVCDLECQTGLTICGAAGAEECVNLLTDNRYCSDATDICGTACAPGEICNGAGVCDLDCQMGLTICGAAGAEECVNLLTDNRYCSDATDICGTACAPGEICNGAGVCDLQCQTGLTLCGAAGAEECVNLLTDDRYCSSTPGVCGAACAAGETCNSGVCELECQTGLTICGAAGSEECVNLLTDDRYCSATPGVCGAACAAGETCNSGVCELECQMGLTLCGAAGSEECVNLLTDNRYCSATPGVCGAACPLGQVCDGSGVCAPTCQAGLTVCNGECVDPDYDPAHCGGCNAPCGAGMACVVGTCMELAAPAPCTTGTNGVVTGDPWVVCEADTNTAWVSADNGGTYAALSICQSLGYSQLTQWGGTWGTVCGGTSVASSCSSPGSRTFDGNGTGCAPNLCTTVHWECTK